MKTIPATEGLEAVVAAGILNFLTLISNTILQEKITVFLGMANSQARMGKIKDEPRAALSVLRSIKNQKNGSLLKEPKSQSDKAANGRRQNN